MYCQYGETERRTARRQIFVSVEQLKRELDTIGRVAADWVTFAGLGEPTLAANLRDLVAVVRQALALPVCYLDRRRVGRACRCASRPDVL